MYPLHKRTRSTGKHDELIAKNGIYKKLVQRQLQGSATEITSPLSVSAAATPAASDSETEPEGTS